DMIVDSDSNNVITINEPHSFGGGNLEIEVPVRTNLNLQSHNGSIISVDGVEGDIEATNHNGSVNMSNVSGSVVAYSHNGKVVVAFRDTAPDRPMSFSSMNGNVDLTLPASAKANLKMRTDNGTIWSDFDIQRKANPSGGKTVDGTINGGGADFDLRTHNGNIFLRRAK
ncbi:MAG TPA: DUF4097 family beta strand repeat-containing protein, partial [Terriglobia bacterium]|nr:DUF4097 family beta strand repeat-containing protein [Terriglobia bacterium]